MKVIPDVLREVVSVCRELYGDRLVALAVFGSVARGTSRLNSDIDLLVVADDLPARRLERVREFSVLDKKFGNVQISPLLKTVSEIREGSPLMLDMVEDAIILYDKDGFLQQQLHLLKKRLARLGAKRIWQGSLWYWDLKPDYQPVSCSRYEHLLPSRMFVS